MIENLYARNHVLKVAPAVIFDASNPEHRAAWVHFNKTGKWLIKFEAEWPFVTVPQTVLTKLALHACSAEVTASEN